MSSPLTRSTVRTALRSTLGAAAGPTLGLLAAATLAAPGAAAVPLAMETTTPAPSPSGSAAAPASATGTSAPAEGYRFWGYYQQGSGKWEFSQTGAFQVVPKDGAVDGWRFAAASMQNPRGPRALPTFDAICGKTAAEAGKKRVGVVIDYGRKADAGADVNPPAPIARCASVTTGASGAEVLNAVAGPRQDKGMVCAIDNWPGSTGCGEAVATIAADAKAADDKVDISVSAPREQPKTPDAAENRQAADQGPSKSLLTAIAVVVVALAAALAWLLRRRRHTAPVNPASPSAPSGTAGTAARSDSGRTSGPAGEGSGSVPRDADPTA